MSGLVSSNLVGIGSFGRSVGKGGDVGRADVVQLMQVAINIRTSTLTSIWPNICLIRVTRSTRLEGFESTTLSSEG